MVEDMGPWVNEPCVEQYIWVRQYMACMLANCCVMCMIDITLGKSLMTVDRYDFEAQCLTAPVSPEPKGRGLVLFHSIYGFV